MLVGIACSPDSYRELPIPVRDGYIFDGWYYDKDFTKKLNLLVQLISNQFQNMIISVRLDLKI